jgi:hypothetical protein
MYETHDRDKSAGFSFTLSEVAASPSDARPGPQDFEPFANRAEQGSGEAKSSWRLNPSQRAWCAWHAARRNIPQPAVEEALVMLNHDRPLLENVLNTAEQTGFSPASIIESILERRG